MQSDSENGSVAAAMVAALVTKRPAATNETQSQNAMRAYMDKLKELVPQCPKNRNVSKLELIQHVIDYINDLQETLQNDTEGDTPPMSPTLNPLSFTEAFSHLSFADDGSLSELKSSSSSPSYNDCPSGFYAAAYKGSPEYDSRGSSPTNNSDTDYSSDEYTPSHHYSQQHESPFYTNSLTLQVEAPGTPVTTPITPTYNNDPRRFYRKGYGLPAHFP